MAVILNASTSTGFVQSADTSGTLELQSNGSTKLTVASTGVSGTLVQGTAVASTSGTSIDFTGIPSWAKKVTVMFNGVSTNNTSPFMIRLGTGSTTYATTGYSSTVSVSTGTSVNNITAGFCLTVNQEAAALHYGIVTLQKIDGNVWVESSVLVSAGGPNPATCPSGGSISLSDVLTAVRITTVNGTQAFDAGTINIQYEG